MLRLQNPMPGYGLAFQSAACKLPAPQSGSLQPNLFAEPLPTAALRRFAVIGDAGDGKRPQFRVAKAMQRLHESKAFASVLVLGDNVYENGEPEKFDRVIKKPYEGLMEKGVRFFPVMGNHDVRHGFGPQQLAYWGVPQFYSRRLGNVEIFALDTTVFLPYYDKAHIGDPQGALRRADAQLAWLESALARSTAKYKVVYGHYPLYSSGMHGLKDDATIRLRQILEPVLARHGVNIYLAGHEHHYEKSFPVLNNQVDPVNGLRHFVSGAAGKLRSDIWYRDNAPYPRERLIAKNHFMLFEETPVGLKYEAIDWTGKTLDTGMVASHEIRKRSGFSRLA